MMTRVRGVQRLIVIAALTTAGCGPGTAADGQELHSAKAEFFADVATWSPVTPADIALPEFRPFRAVYERFYTQASGPGAGEARQDWVVVTADLAAWDQAEAIAVSMYDTGNPLYSDTNGRLWHAYVDRQNLELFLELGPLPGAAKDYYVLRRTDDGLRGAMVQLEEEQAEFQNGPAEAPRGIAIAPWAMASLLQAGRSIRIDSYDGVTANGFGNGPAVVVGPSTFEDPAGESWDTWQVDQLGNPSSARLNRLQLVPRPPYLIARYAHDLETGENLRGMRLVSFQYLDIPPTTATSAR